MLICGLDPGLHRTGYGIITANAHELKLVDAGLITTTPRAALAERLVKLHREITSLLAESPDLTHVAVEDIYSHYRHPRTAVLMAHARGVLLLAAQSKGIEIVSLPATMVKKAIVGQGHANKVQVQRAVMLRLGITADHEVPSDVTDALALAVCCFEHQKQIQ